MNYFVKLSGWFISIPARLRGLKIGKDSVIGPGYDFVENNMKGILIGDNVVIGRSAWLQTEDHNARDILYIGNGTRIGRNVTISAKKGVRIGRNCMLSFNVSILDHDHNFNLAEKPLSLSGTGDGSIITIGDDCFIGAHSFILKGVSLGKRCIVGANSVVTKSFPAFSVIAGNPAKLIKKTKNH